MKLHHVGLVVANIEEHMEGVRALYGFELLDPPVADPLQNVRVAFVNVGTEVTVELIEPLDETSPVARFLEQGGGLNHLCYTVNELEETIAHLRNEGCLVVSEPKPAVAFEKQRVAFLVTPERQLIELLEEVS